MRISDWSSDVCSSDLIVEFDPLTGKKVASLDYVRVFANSHYVTPGPTLKQAMEGIRHELAERLKELEAEGKLLEHQRLEQRTNFDLEMIARSEEHTSELQSLMRISYAVFCLKKKNDKHTLRTCTR